MARPEYPSDEKRRKTKPAARIHHSVTHHPKMAAVYGDNDLFATWTRIMVASSIAHIGKTGDRLTFARAAAMTLAGRTQLGSAMATLRRCCAALTWELRESGDSITITVRNFARKQGFDSAGRGVVAETDAATPAPSESESESESEKENPPVAPLAETKRRSVPKHQPVGGLASTKSKNPNPENGNGRALRTPLAIAVLTAWAELAARFDLRPGDVDPDRDPGYYRAFCKRLQAHPDPSEWAYAFEQIPKMPGCIGRGSPPPGKTDP